MPILLFDPLSPSPCPSAFVGADIVLTLIGGITLELFSRRAMQTLFRRFFEHVVFQVQRDVM